MRSFLVGCFVRMAMTRSPFGALRPREPSQDEELGMPKENPLSPTFRALTWLLALFGAAFLASNQFGRRLEETSVGNSTI